MQLPFSPHTLRELVRPIAEEIAAAIDSLSGDDNQLSYPVAQAAKLLGIATHQLRGARLWQEITLTPFSGRIGYEGWELLAYLARNRSK